MSIELAQGGSRPRGDSVDALAKWFVLCAAIILAITGIAKLWSMVGNAKVLGVADPILGIKFRYLLLATGLVELIITGVCLFEKSRGLATLLIAWLATSFVVYRLGLWWLDWKRPCGCLGNLTDALHVSPELAEGALKVILGCLLIGSYATVIARWKRRL